jgi:membrane protein YqaA with SNARE-associated domain
MVENEVLQFLLYLLRWQLSTIILAPVIHLGSRRRWAPLTSAIIANLIGGAIFFWVDKFLIFS